MKLGISKSSAVFVAVCVILASAPFAGAARERAAGLTAGQAQPLEIAMAESRDEGLSGFVRENILPDSDEPVSVIALFHSQPPAVQMAQARAFGLAPLSEQAAEMAVSAEHELFRRELSALFPRHARTEDDPPYRIRWVYTTALNGVNIVLPSNMVAALAEFDSVRVVYPDFYVALDLPPSSGRISSDPSILDAPWPPVPTPIPEWAVNAGRASMRADELHAAGYRGSGVVVAVLDTGIYYEHPSFWGAFLSIEEMQARGAAVDVRDGILAFNGETGVPERVFVGRNFFTGAAGSAHPNNPAEVGMEADIESRTWHGTHVAGIVAARDNPLLEQEDVTTLGLAPEANIFVYRMLDPRPGESHNRLWGEGSVAIAAIQQAVRDGADVVNMSFGRIEMIAGSATDLVSIAINNEMMNNPYVVFVALAGNEGPNMYTLRSPGGGSAYITVANADIREANPDNWLIYPRSARGPSLRSFEINPDIAAHGTDVWSTMPSFQAIRRLSGGEEVLTRPYFGTADGTSMSAAHISGAAALLIEYSRRNGGQWTAEEIKVRLMNNAIPFSPNGSSLGVFHTGAGFADVYAAARNDTYVFVEYDRVPRIDEGTNVGSLANQSFRTAQTGSFSFGEVGSYDTPFSLLAPPREYAPDPSNVRTLSAGIVNGSGAAREYVIDYSFTRNPGSAAVMTLSRRAVTVPPGQTGRFSATMTVAGDVPSGGLTVFLSEARFNMGAFQGHVYVRDRGSGELVARLPFGLVNRADDFAQTRVPATRLSFNLGGDDRTVPATIDPINVLAGTQIQHFIENHHRGFTHRYGGFPAAGPAFEGRRFSGWFLDAAFTRPLTESTVMPAHNLTLFARWEMLGGQRVAVVPGSFDNVGAVLTRMGVGFDPLTAADFERRAMGYDIIFINCAAAPSPQTLRNFVAAGGTLYASDLSASALGAAFPQHVAFARTRPHDFSAMIVNPGLASHMGASRMDVAGLWEALPIRFPADATVYLTHPAMGFPAAFSFPYGEGRVFFTSFHNSAQANQSVARFLEYLVFSIRNADVVAALEGIAHADGYVFGGAVFEMLAPGASSRAFSHRAVEGYDFRIILPPGADDFTLYLIDPLSNVYTNERHVMEEFGIMPESVHAAVASLLLGLDVWYWHSHEGEHGHSHEDEHGRPSGYIDLPFIEPIVPDESHYIDSRPARASEPFDSGRMAVTSLGRGGLAVANPIPGEWHFVVVSNSDATALFVAGIAERPSQDAGEGAGDNGKDEEGDKDGGGGLDGDAWDTEAIYLEGDAVVYGGLPHIARWWTRGDRPDGHNANSPWLFAGGGALPWRDDIPHLEGAMVSFGGREYVSTRWANAGERPGAAWGPWGLVGDGDGNTAAPPPAVGEWDPGTVYFAGELAAYGGTIFRARWWTQGDRPDAGSPWGAWEVAE